MGEKFQKEGEEMLKNMKEYVRHGKFSGSEESNSTDEESMSQRSTNRYLGIRESPLVVLRQQVLGHGSCQENNSSLQKPSARLPESTCEGLSSQRLSEEKTFSSEKTEDELMHGSRKPAAASSDNNSGRVRFLSFKLPGTGSGMRGGFHPMSSKSPDAVNMSPFLKRKVLTADLPLRQMTFVREDGQTETVQVFPTVKYLNFPPKALMVKSFLKKQTKKNSPPEIVQ